MLEQYMERRIMTPYLARKRDQLVKCKAEDEIPVMFLTNSAEILSDADDTGDRSGRGGRGGRFRGRGRGRGRGGRFQYATYGGSTDDKDTICVSREFMAGAVGLPLTEEHREKLKRLIMSEGMSEQDANERVDLNPLKRIATVEVALAKVDAKWAKELSQVDGFRHRMALAIRSVLQTTTLGRRERTNPAKPETYAYTPYCARFLLYYSPPNVRITIPDMNHTTAYNHRFMQVLEVHRPKEKSFMTMRNDGMIDTDAEAQVRTMLGTRAPVPSDSEPMNSMLDVLRSRGNYVDQDLDVMASEFRWYSLGSPISASWSSIAHSAGLPPNQLPYDPMRVDRINAFVRACEVDYFTGRRLPVPVGLDHAIKYPETPILHQALAAAELHQDIRNGKYDRMTPMSTLLHPMPVAQFIDTLRARLLARAAPPPLRAPVRLAVDAMDLDDLRATTRDQFR